MTGCGGANNVPITDVVSQGAVTRAEVDAVPAPTWEEFDRAVNAAVENHPDVAVDSAQFQRVLFDAVKNEVNSPTRVYPLLKVTSEEFWLLASTPCYAVKMPAIRNDAISTFTDQTDNINDAYRHAYFNVLMCKRCDVSWASRLATAHESENSGPAKVMDLNNNAVGRNIYGRNSNLSEAQLADKIRQYSRLFWQQTDLMPTGDFLVYFKR